MIRVGICGFGYWGPNVARSVIRNPAFQLGGVADRRKDILSSARFLDSSVCLYEEAEELIETDNIDAVVIATPVANHFALARKALLGKKHVLIEKPLSSSVAECEELVAIAERVDRVLMVDHTFLFTGAVQTIKRVISAGELGKICYFDSMRVNLGLFQPDVNCLWDLAPHDLSIIDHLIGDDVVSIDVSGYCHVNPKSPDMVYLTLHYENDMVAHLNLSWMSPVKVRRIAIGGTKQMLIWDDLDQEQKIRIYNSGIEFRSEAERPTIIPDYRIGDIFSPRVSRHEALSAVIDHFGKVITRKEMSIMDGTRGMRVVRVLEETQRLLDEHLRDVAKRRRTAGQ